MFEKELGQVRALYRQGLYSPGFYSRRIPGEECFSDYEAFTQIPFMYKHEIRGTEAFERTTAKKDEVYGIFSSSGTTGSKTYYVYSKKDKKVHEEFVHTFYTELGIQADDLGGVFAPVDTGVMAHTMMWQYTTMGAGYVNCPEPSPENMIGILKALPVTVIATRPNVVCTIAANPEFVEAAQKSTVRKMLMGGGFLSSGRRKLIERIWDADCYNMFGMSEMFGPMAGECRQKDGQHYLNQYLMIEIIDPKTGRLVQEGEVGIAVYTTLWDKGFPLLRYWTDDLMAIDRTPCKCGSPYPRLRYKGRMADCMVLDGAYVFPEALENCLMGHGFYLDYEARQEQGKIKVRVEKEPAQEVPAQMLQEINEIFHTDAMIEFAAPRQLGYRGHGPRFFPAG
ncbi:MAG: phenylacetate--CoA ligase family protein [Lachnospiraceae bacterium]|jgi:phenylacetate-CoA ligase|nr:phenylacetate--CoA ligase family protein [Lachnospiraceae bacterium]